MSLQPRRDYEPNEGDLALHQGDLYDAKRSLRSRWPVQSTNPLISALESNRNAMLALIESSERILGVLFTPIEVHACDRPEDCSCPECRTLVDQWALSNHGFIAADHPKANPMPSERELARTWNA